METTVIEHPVVCDRLAALRNRETSRPDFRAALHELSLLLVYESIRDLPVRVVDIETPMGPASGATLAEVPVLVPVLRAAIGMLDAALSLIPDAHVAFLGLRRNETTREPETYLQTAVDKLHGQVAIVLDPMLATGGSLEHACRVATNAGARSLTAVSVLSAPEGVARIEATGMVQRLFTAAIDSHLDDAAFIVPGLGDAGDRQFGAP